METTTLIIIIVLVLALLFFGYTIGKSDSAGSLGGGGGYPSGRFIGGGCGR